MVETKHPNDIRFVPGFCISQRSHNGKYPESQSSKHHSKCKKIIPELFEELLRKYSISLRPIVLDESFMIDQTTN
jgi:hypothetical protein